MKKEKANFCGEAVGNGDLHLIEVEKDGVK